MIEWKIHDVKFACGNYRKCLARLDSGQKWLVSDVNMSTRTFRDLVRRFAQRIDALLIEVKYMYDEAEQAEQNENLIRLSEYRGTNGYDFSRMMRYYVI